MTAAMEKDTFIIRHHCGIGFEAQIQRGEGSVLTGLAFRERLPPPHGWRNTPRTLKR
jgi:hypothetical protein